MAHLPASREEAAEADRNDPLRALRACHFADAGRGPIYLDGNSLGRPTRSSAQALGAYVEEWENELISGWTRWRDLPFIVGDLLGLLLGAGAGQVALSDSTTVNLFKLASAAIDARAARHVLVGDLNDFPTVRYVLEGLAAKHGLELRLVESGQREGCSVDSLRAALDDEVALVCCSSVNYRSGALLDITATTRAVHDVGALTLFDLSHSAGAVPHALDADEVDLAVGCTYKYLNGGPGAPAFLYVRRELQDGLRQPIWGWWGQRDPFAMAPSYDPDPGLAHYLAGTPSILAIAGVQAGIAPHLEVGIDALWTKSQQLVALLAHRATTRLHRLGATIASPSDPHRRGAHLSIAHPQAQRLSELLAQRRLVVGDFRHPDVLRLAPVPLYTGYVETWDAIEHVAGVLEDL